jgi:uncharacterized membrane protein YdcZ (DUF606 family)
MIGEQDSVATAPASQNNVWQTLGGFVGALGDIYIKSETLKSTRASAAPAGAAAMPAANSNPFAGFFSSFPQNDTKGQYQNPAPFNFGSINPLWILLLGALGLLFVFARR